MGFSVAPWLGGARGAMPPLLLRAVGKLPMLSEIVGKLSRLSEIVKVVDGGEGGEDLKCCRPEKCLVCRKKISVCRKSTALAPPPQKKTWVPRRHWGFWGKIYILKSLVIYIV
jgi:hypothetical protein